MRRLRFAFKAFYYILLGRTVAYRVKVSNEHGFDFRGQRYIQSGCRITGMKVGFTVDIPESQRELRLDR